MNFYRFCAACLAAAAFLFSAPVAAQGPAAGASPAHAPVIASPAPGADPHPLSVEAFAELPFLFEPILSPDGARIAARVSSGGREWIGIWTLSEPRDHPPKLIEVGDIERFAWAGSGRLIISTVAVRLMSSGVLIAYGPARQIFVYDLASDKSMPLGQSHGMFADVIFIDPLGRYVLVSDQDNLINPPHVERIDLATGAAVEVQRRMGDVWSWFADANGVVRVGVDYDEHRTRIYYRSTPDAPLTHADTHRDLRDGSAIDTIRFVTASDHAVIVTNAQTGRFGVYNYDFATDTLGAAIFEHPEVDVTAAIFSPEGGVDGVTYEDDRPRVHWLDPASAQLQAMIDRTLPGKTNTIVNRSRDDNRVLIFSSAADDPGTYYVFDRAARRMEVFASPYNSLVGHDFAPVRSVSYRDRAGFTIHAYLTLPAGRPEHGLPLIVLPHGGPFLRDSWAFDPEVQFLASRGYAVLQPNFRGSTGYGRDFVQSGYGQYGGAMIDDMEDGIDWLADQGIADRARVCIMGSSYGGYAAIWGAMRSPSRYRCAISFAGPTDLRAILRYDSQSFMPRRYVRAFRQQLEGEERADLDAVAPARHPELLHVPLLLAQGRQDPIVPPDQAERLLSGLTRVHAPVESVFFDKAGHGFNDAAEATDFYRRVEAFLAAHNPAGTQPPAAAH
jgi:dipeptidyl aminopeptidase/acylaminoacyl peptidase